MPIPFYVSAVVAIMATLMVVTRRNAFHALLYLVASMLALAVAFFSLGAPFAAALEVLIYAGAIMVLFVFVVMMLNLGAAGVARERILLQPGTWIGPALICALLLVELSTLLWDEGAVEVVTVVGPKSVGTVLFGPYLLAVELASMLLLAALVGAWQIGQGEEAS